ncbi:MAG: hypothetical protein K6E29_05280 [Cyanobacteria bacterium RUI128]|nr:hypothetical protein [Cyanobacteria bacterium RUI128]
MTELENLESLGTKFDEIKSLVDEMKNAMMTSEDCNNQFYSVLQSLENIVTTLNELNNEQAKPTDEYTILQTNILEVKKELGKMNVNVDEVINQDLKELISRLTEKVNRLEILTNNAGINDQVVKNFTGEIEKNMLNTLRNSSETLYNQALTSSELIKKDISLVNDNMKDCVDYLQKYIQTVSDDAVQHISDDLTVLGTTVEKTTDNLKRSVIDIFSRIQTAVENGGSLSAPVKEEEPKIDTQEIVDHFEMLKTGLYNLNANTEQRISKLNHLVEELEIFNKLEKFSQLKDLPAIGDLKHTLQSNINRIVEEYSYTLQTSQNREELNKATQSFRKDVYNSLMSMLGNVSEFLVDEETLKEQKKTQFEQFSEKLDELVSVTELNNSGYDNIQIELKEITSKCADISDLVKDNAKRATSRGVSVEEALAEIKSSVEELHLSGDALKRQNNEIGDVIRESAKSIVESSVPDRNSIKDMLVDIKKNISILQSGDEETDYTYSMQDIESDVAKIRIYLNELNQNGVSVNSEEFTEELNSIVVMVDTMRQQMNKIDECNIADTMTKMKEDVTSISTRVNKLLLTSDNSYNLIEGALNEFKLLAQDIDEQIKNVSNSTKFSSLEEGMTAVKMALAESNNYNSIINQSLIMLAEWVDNAGETITNIYEKQSKLDSIDELKTLVKAAKASVDESSETVIGAVKELLGGIELPQPVDYSQEFTSLSGKLAEQGALIEKQEVRLLKLDEKLTTILELTAKSDVGVLASKIEDIDAKLEKLTKNLEKLTAFVNED